MKVHNHFWQLAIMFKEYDIKSSKFFMEDTGFSTEEYSSIDQFEFKHISEKKYQLNLIGSKPEYYKY